MKKVFALIAVFGMLSMGTLTAQEINEIDSTEMTAESSQDEMADVPAEVPTQEPAPEQEQEETVTNEEEVVETAGISQSLKLKFLSLIHI